MLIVEAVGGGRNAALSKIVTSRGFAWFVIPDPGRGLDAPRALLVDPILFPVANDPYTSIACLVYLVLLGASATILVAAEGSAGT